MLLDVCVACAAPLLLEVPYCCRIKPPLVMLFVVGAALVLSRAPLPYKMASVTNSVV